MGKKKKNKKRKPKPEQIFRPLSWLPTVAKIIDGSLADALEQVELFTQAKAKPWCLDDQTVNRALRVHREGLEFSSPQRAQLVRWQADPGLTQAQRAEIERLLEANETLRQTTQKVLALLEEIAGSTIEAIVDKDPGELAWEVLSGQRPAPEPPDQASMLEDFLPEMQLPELTTPLRRAKAALDLHRLVEEVGGGRQQLWLHPEIIPGALKCKAIIRSADLVEFTDLRERFPGFQTFVLGMNEIRMAIEEGKIELPG